MLLKSLLKLLLYEALDILQTHQKVPLDFEVNNSMLFQVSTQIKIDTTCMECIILCLFKLPVSLNDLPHSLHVCDCTLMYTYLLKAKLHNVERHETFQVRFQIAIIWRQFTTPIAAVSFSVLKIFMLIE